VGGGALRTGRDRLLKLTAGVIVVRRGDGIPLGIGAGAANEVAVDVVVVARNDVAVVVGGIVGARVEHGLDGLQGGDLAVGGCVQVLALVVGERVAVGVFQGLRVGVVVLDIAVLIGGVLGPVLLHDGQGIG